MFIKLDNDLKEATQKIELKLKAGNKKANLAPNKTIKLKVSKKKRNKSNNNNIPLRPWEEDLCSFPDEDPECMNPVVP